MYKGKGTRITKTILKKKKVEGIILSFVKTVIKTL